MAEHESPIVQWIGCLPTSEKIGLIQRAMHHPAAAAITAMICRQDSFMGDLVDDVVIYWWYPEQPELAAPTIMHLLRSGGVKVTPISPAKSAIVNKFIRKATHPAGREIVATLLSLGMIWIRDDCISARVFAETFDADTTLDILFFGGTAIPLEISPIYDYYGTEISERAIRVATTGEWEETPTVIMATVMRLYRAIAADDHIAVDALVDAHPSLVSYVWAPYIIAKYSSEIFTAVFRRHIDLIRNDVDALVDTYLKHIVANNRTRHFTAATRSRGITIGGSAKAQALFVRAVSNGHRILAKMIIDAGVDTVTPVKGRTLAEIAARANSPI